MTGFGPALIANSALANAFGGELAAQFTILQDRGVESNVAGVDGGATAGAVGTDESGHDHGRRNHTSAAQSGGSAGDRRRIDEGHQQTDPRCPGRDPGSVRECACRGRLRGRAIELAGSGGGPDEPRDHGQPRSRKPATKAGNGDRATARDLRRRTGTTRGADGGTKQQQRDPCRVTTKPQSGEAIGPGMTEAARIGECGDRYHRPTPHHDPDPFRHRGAAHAYRAMQGDARSYSERAVSRAHRSQLQRGRATRWRGSWRRILPGVVDGYVVD